jgi:creatinine amidohydrolase
MTEIEWGRLKAHELRTLAEDDAILIVPIGATEQHGPHLPVMVDYRLAHEVAVRAARLIAEHQPIVVAPVIPYGMSEHHVSLGGTLTLDFATMQAVLDCVCGSAIRQGFRRTRIALDAAAPGRFDRRAPPPAFGGAAAGGRPAA